ncbi:MAG: deoxyuridine 5'-triphosphate nucleotidohydrolase [Hyperthermus sp.]|nr:MAG: deoxyuridine 5'-triphosphate nucleotidohydrolase [Hyperthermus sp.]
MAAVPGWIASYIAAGGSPSLEAIQPAGIDLSLDKVYEFLEAGVLSRGGRKLPGTRELREEEGRWVLKPGAYKIRFSERVFIPQSFLGLCLPRSSLLRMGALLSCALWDPGYHGRGEALLTVHNPHGLVIEKGARVAQLVLIRIKPTPYELYRGFYHGENLT